MLAALIPNVPPAILALADGSVFHGISIGVAGKSAGEVVFNTAMTGYQEILTDPSYAQQLVTLTCSHIGNYGVNPQDAESRRIFAAGLIIKNLPPRHSNFRAQQSLEQYLQTNNTVAIANVNTRQLTRHLRTHGAQNGCILALSADQQIRPDLINRAIQAAQSAPAMAGLDLVQAVSTNQAYEWTQTAWHPEQGYATQGTTHRHVLAYDFGVKHNILRMLAERGCKVTVVPARTSAQEALALQPDGVFLSNGPGDPAPCAYAIAAVQTLLKTNIPVFGICLGHQILALALGAKTFKMKFGHHGANHPVKNLSTGHIAITSQNHGFAVEESSLPSSLRVTHRSLFDGTVQGLQHTEKPVFCFQGHPEASPGPQDIGYLFDHFVQLMQDKSQSQSVAHCP